MTAEPAFTLGLSNTVFWTAGAGATRVETEVSPAASAPGEATAVSRTFAPLDDGILYAYRARSITEFPFGPVASAWSASVSSLQLRGDGDQDGDGVRDADEVDADTDPLDPGSVLRIIEFYRADDAFELIWTGGRLARQEILASESLDANALWFPIHEEKPPTAITNALTIPASGNSRFFRVRAFPSVTQ
jgi:hypothetical protein